MLSDSDLMPPEMEEQLSEEASNLPNTSEPPSAALRSFHFKKGGKGANTPDITDNLLNMDLLAPSYGAAGGAAGRAEPSATASTSTSQSHLPGIPEGAERAVLGGDMTARQSAISRVAAGIVPPTQYRGASCTAQLASGSRMDTEVDYQTLAAERKGADWHCPRPSPSLEMSVAAAVLCLMLCSAGSSGSKESRPRRKPYGPSKTKSGTGSSGSKEYRPRRKPDGLSYPRRKETSLATGSVY